MNQCLDISGVQLQSAVQFGQGPLRLAQERKTHAKQVMNIGKALPESTTISSRWTAP